MATRTPTRLAGPALVTNSAATKYTVPGATVTVLRHIHVVNPSVSAATFTLSIGVDAAGTRLFDAVSIAAGGELDRHVYLPLAAAEIIQALSGTNNVLVLTLGGDQIA